MESKNINNSNKNYEDFTESKYAELISLAKKKYNFISYTDYKKKGQNILWRHDVDISVNRAFTLSKIEKESNITSTYFFHLHSFFYNLFEEDIALLAKKILSLGHELGLHFDPCFYQKTISPYCDLIMFAKIEKKILEELFFSKVVAISFHNPDTFSNFDSGSDKILGMVNVNSEYIKNKYSYCSDSNGYWRYKRLENILMSSEDKYLQVLTHPEWWVPSPMSPRERINRCIDGRAKKQNIYYDELLRSLGRENIR